MEMTPDEIVVDYRQAKNKGQQIKILADLNLCSIEDILQVLVDHGGYERQRINRAWEEESKYAEYSKELERIRKKLSEAEANYQCTGSASAYRTVRKYEALEDVYMLALGALNGDCRRCGSTERRVRTLLGKYKNDDLTVKSSAVRDDLIDICPEAAVGGNHG